MENDSHADSATVTGFDSFHYDATVAFATSSGMAVECEAANSSGFGITVTFPCGSTAAYDAAR